MSGWLWPAMASLFAGMAIIMLVVGMPILPWHYNSAQRSSSSGEISSHGGGSGETSPLQYFALQARVIGCAACAWHAARQQACLAVCDGPTEAHV